MKFVRSAATAAAVAIAGISLVAFVGTGSAGAVTAPPYEPISFSFGTLTFYDSTGAVKTSGNVTDKPFAAFTAGSAAGRTGDHSTLLNIAQPNPSANAGNWNVDTLTGQTDYPLSATGNPASIVTVSQSHPVSKGTAGDLSLGDFIKEFPNTDPSGLGCAYSGTSAGCTNTGYQNLYELRLVTTNGADQNPQVEVADVLVSGTTWTQVYPAPAAGPTTTATTLAASPSGSANANANVTLTATESPAAAGSVQFKDGSTALGSPVAVNGSGVATFQSTSFAVGSHSFSAVFTPSDTGAVSGSTSTALSYTINSTAVSTAMTLDASPPGPVTTGTQTTLTAHLDPANAVGAVQFKDGSTSVGSPVAVSGGTAALPAQAFPIGDHSFTAVFTPTDASAFSGSTSNLLPYKVSQQPATSTSTALAVTAGMPQVYGQALPMTATVTPNNAVGSVHFFDGVTDIGAVAVGADGTASISPTNLAAGTRSLTAQFVPTNDADFGTSTSSAMQVAIDPAQSGMTLAASPTDTAKLNAPVALTATVTPSGATGSVQFFDGDTALGDAVAVGADSTAKANVTTLGIGSHSLTATFSPAPANWATSTSDTTAYTITAADTTTTLNVTPPTPAAHAVTETLTATVSPSTAAGSVQFFDGETTLGDPVTITGGTASMQKVLDDGPHALSAKFTSSEEATYLDSTSDAVTYVVAAPPQTTMTTLQSNPAGPVSAGSTVALTATVTPSGAAGTVRFKDGGTAIGAPVAVSSGSASITSPHLHGGSHSFTADFTPTDPTAFATSTTSAAVSVLVTAVGTTTTLAASPQGPVTHGANVTLTATVGPNGATGSVEFLNGTTSLGTANLTGTTASLQTAVLPVGTASLTARFTATNAADFITSTSAPVSLEVDPAAAIDGVTNGGQNVSAAHPGEALTITASGFTPNSTVTATLHSTPMTLGHATATAQGTVQLTVTLPSTVATGSHTLTLSDGTHTASMPLTVNSSGTQGTHTTTGTGSASSNGGTSATGGTAVTGVNSLRGVLIGVGITALGALLLIFGIRRYRGSHRFG